MNPQQIEATGKVWKATLALGVLLILGGFAWWAAAASTGNASDGSGVMILVGLTAYFTGRIGGWWCHG